MNNLGCMSLIILLILELTLTLIPHKYTFFEASGTKNNIIIYIPYIPNCFNTLSMHAIPVSIYTHGLLKQHYRLFCGLVTFRELQAKVPLFYCMHISLVVRAENFRLKV